MELARVDITSYFGNSGKIESRAARITVGNRVAIKSNIVKNQIKKKMLYMVYFQRNLQCKRQ